MTTYLWLSEQVDTRAIQSHHHRIQYVSIPGVRLKISVSSIWRTWSVSHWRSQILVYLIFRHSYFICLRTCYELAQTQTKCKWTVAVPAPSYSPLCREYVEAAMWSATKIFGQASIQGFSEFLHNLMLGWLLESNDPFAHRWLFSRSWDITIQEIKHGVLKNRPFISDFPRLHPPFIGEFHDFSIPIWKPPIIDVSVIFRYFPVFMCIYQWFSSLPCLMTPEGTS